MSDLKQAAQQALDYIEQVDYGPYDNQPVKQALRAALEAQEQHDTDCHAQGVCQRSGYSIGGPKPLTDEEILSAVGWERAEMYMKLLPNFPVDEAKQETLKNARAVERAHGIKGGNDE